MGISVCDGPPYSPGLNPIEHVWKMLKEPVLEMDPELKDIAGEENICEALGNALKEAWNALPQDLFDDLMENLEKRIKACIKAKG